MQYTYKHYIITASIILSHAAYGMNSQPIDMQGDGWRDQSMAPRVSALLAKRRAEQEKPTRILKSLPADAHEQLARFSFTTHFLQLLDTHGKVNPFSHAQGTRDKSLLEKMVTDWQCIMYADELVNLAQEWQNTAPTDEMIATWHRVVEDKITSINEIFERTETSQAEIDQRTIKALFLLSQKLGAIKVKPKHWPKQFELQPETKEFLTAVRSEAHSMLSFVSAAQKLVQASQTT